MLRTGIAAAVILVAPAALADEAPYRPVARLEVDRGAGADACPDRQALTEAVAGRLGYDPFVPAGGDLRIRVQFVRGADGLAGSVEAFDPAGEPKGEKKLASKRGDCSEVAQAATLTIAILLDPRTGLVTRPRVTETAPEPTPFEPPPPTVDKPPPSPPKSTLVPRVRLGAIGSVGAEPDATVGVRAGVGLVDTKWAIDLELRADLPREATAADKKVTTGVIGGALAPCLRSGTGVTLEGCAVALIGALRSEAEGGAPANEQSLVVMVGPRVGVVVPLSETLALNAHGDVLFALTRTTLRVDAVEVWRTPLVSAGLGVALEAHFP